MQRRAEGAARRRGRRHADRRPSRSTRTGSTASSSTRRRASACPASPQYTIDVLTDQPPTVSIAKPGRDTKASPIEEVFVEARAEDDFGVSDLELVYSVNGGAEKIDPPVRRQEPARGSDGRPHVLSRGARRQARRLRVVLRARRRQRRRAAASGVERHLLRADPSAAQGLQPRRVGCRRRRRRRRRRRTRSARSRSSSARSSRRPSTSSAIARR